jgi:hypothetical protein
MAGAVKRMGRAAVHLEVLCRLRMGRMGVISFPVWRFGTLRELRLRFLEFLSLL